MLTVLVVGQTPPPFGGQAMMIKQLLAGHYRGVRLLHVRMNFSKDMDSAGKFRVAKIFELFSVLVGIVWARQRHPVDVLYYPPAGPNHVPVLRDIFLLFFIRCLFPKTVFHFHASGLVEIYPRLPAPARYFFRVAYFNPDVAIRLSPRTPEDGRFLRAHREFVIPYGIADEADGFLTRKPNRDGPVRILFVGVLREDKGVLVLLRACQLLLNSGVRFELSCVGKFVSNKFQEMVLRFVGEADMAELIHFPGVLSGRAKLTEFAKADLFCFPTFFHSEAFPVVLLEAMSFGLPIVTTDWRGIPDITQDSGCAFLCDIQNEHAIAESLSRLIRDPELRYRMGGRARKHFLQHFTLERYYGRLQEVFDYIRESSCQKDSAGVYS
jgi:glycosyltransferase involved in cell wall biosynthesis